MKPTANQVARAATLAAHVGYTYDELDCQAFVEHCVRQAGGRMDYLGTNDMARRAAWLGTLDEARAQGRLVPGAGLLIREATEANLPARYAGDGLGDFSHVGLYVGEDALTDVDKNGNARSCDVVHSSATMGRVAGSTLQNGWTHVLWFPEIDYGASGSTLANGWTHVMWFQEIDYGNDAGLGVDQGADSGDVANGGMDMSDELTAGTPAQSAERYAVVVSPDGGPVKLRKSASAEETLYWLVNAGARVQVERERDGWALIRAICTDGYTRRAYMMAQYLEDE